MSENIVSTNEVVEPSAEPEGNEDANNDSIESSDSGVEEYVDGEEAVELCKQAKEAGKTVEEYKKEYFAKKKAVAKKADDKKPTDKPPAKEQDKKNVKEEDKKPEEKKLEEKPVTKFKVKANGVEKEVDIEELKSAYSLAQGARKTLQEGLDARKQAVEFVKLMKSPTSFWKAVDDMGLNKYELAETLLVDRATSETLTEEEMVTRNKLKEAENKLKAYEEMEALQKKEQENKEIAQAKAQYAQDFERDFTEALKKVSMPKSRVLIARVAKKVRDAAKVGKELTPIKAAERVKKEFIQEMKDIYGESDDDTLADLVGDKNTERLLIRRGKQVRSSTNYNNNSNSNGNKNFQQKRESGLSWSEWDKQKYKKK